MVRIRLNNIELIKKIRLLDKPYLAVADLEKIIGLQRKSLYVILNRLVKSGGLERLAKNIYVLFTESRDLAKIAGELYFPSYLSFEQALSHYGILPQIPYSLTFATPRPSKKLVLGDLEVEYSHLKKELFFGYVMEKGKYIAEKEKALLDELYMVSLGKRSINLSELDLKDIDRTKLDQYVQRFPARIKLLLDSAKSYLGTTPVTLEGKERIKWPRHEIFKENVV